MVDESLLRTAIKADRHSDGNADRWTNRHFTRREVHYVNTAGTPTCINFSFFFVGVIFPMTPVPPKFAILAQGARGRMTRRGESTDL